MQNLENKQENCNILTICNARGMLRVSKEAENFNKASFCSLVRYFSPKSQKTSKKQLKMSTF